MSNPMASRTNTYAETIEGLKRQLEIHAAKLTASAEWADFAALYRALRAIEEVAAAPKSSLEQLLGMAAAVPSGARQDAEIKSELDLGGQVESEPAAEMEKGS